MLPWHTHEPIAPQLAPVAVSMQLAPVQQGVAWLHVWPMPGHADGWQVPFAAPDGMAQVLPTQQSASAEHVPPVGWQTAAALHAPPVQTIEQHWLLLEHEPLFATQSVPPSPTTITPPSGPRTRPPSGP